MSSQQDISPLIKVETLQNILIERATGGKCNDLEYKTIRRDLLQNSYANKLLPRFVETCQNLDQFWNFIKLKFPSYRERREYIWEQFHFLIDRLEQNSCSPIPHDGDISEVLEKFDTEHVYLAWQRSLERRYQDPEAAITSARTLIESVCKHILDEAGEQYDDKADLPKLYKDAAKKLNMAPEQHQEEIFKQILGGCSSVIQGLGTIRNKLGDAHGKGKGSVKPSKRHATLAVNLAGSMAAFMISAWEEKKEK